MNGVHPALVFLREKVPTACALSPGALLLDIQGARVEIFLQPASGGPVFFAAGETILAYRCSTALSDVQRERVRAVLLELREQLAVARVDDAHAPLPAGGGWTDRIAGGDLAAWRNGVTRWYRTSVEAGRRDECHGLPDCLDLRMRPPIQSPSIALREPPTSGPCSRCGRVRVCAAARESWAGENGLKPLRHADVGSAELAALRVLADAAAVPVPDALAAYARLVDACGDRTLQDAGALEFSVRLATGARQPDRLRFVSYYPMVANDAVRREINRGRRAAVRALAAEWLTERETAALDVWLECTTETQPDTLGLSLGVELDPAGIRLQVYAHPGPSDHADRLVNAVVKRLGGSPDQLPTDGEPPVLVGIALAAGTSPALKLYYRRSWEARHDTGLLPDGVGALAPFNPGWGLAIQEHVDGRAEWVKWDFPVTTHYQIYERFLAAFWQATGDRPESIPDWLSGERFSPWPTWASLGRGGRVLYFQAR